jgi:hypothetical protein
MGDRADAGTWFLPPADLRHLISFLVFIRSMLAGLGRLHEPFVTTASNTVSVTTLTTVESTTAAETSAGRDGRS